MRFKLIARIQCKRVKYKLIAIGWLNGGMDCLINTFEITFSDRSRVDVHQDIHLPLHRDKLLDAAHLYSLPGRQGSWRFLDAGKRELKTLKYATFPAEDLQRGEWLILIYCW
jgi:hypothetical protein